MVKLTPTGVKINTNLVWTSHNTGGVEFNTGVFAVKRLDLVINNLVTTPRLVQIGTSNNSPLIVMSHHLITTFYPLITFLNV